MADSLQTPDLFLRLTPLKPIDPAVKWEDYCTDPMLLFKAFSSFFVVDATELKSTIPLIRSSTRPSADQRNAIWIKTSWPYGIGVFIDGAYQMDWGLSGYPENQPFLMKPADIGATLPGNVTKLSDAQITEFGLTKTTGEHANKMEWYLFTPADVNA